MFDIYSKEIEYFVLPILVFSSFSFLVLPKFSYLSGENSKMILPEEQMENKFEYWNDIENCHFQGFFVYYEKKKWLWSQFIVAQLHFNPSGFQICN